MKDKFCSLTTALETLKAGKMLIVVDDEARENEGDFVMAAQFVTEQDVNFMAREGRGLICAPLASWRARQLQLPLQVVNVKNSSPFQTPFTVSVDLAAPKNTGISALARAQTLQALSDERYAAPDFQKPGHIFPLIANDHGVLGRDGHTEATVELLALANLRPVGVICEILKPDGTMARLPDLVEMAKEWGMEIFSIQQLIKYKLETAKTSADVATRLPTKAFTKGELCLYPDKRNADLEHLALVCNERPNQIPLIRLHSECLTGDLFGSLRCDCGDQLQKSLDLIGQRGHGAIIYLRQEGRGIGLRDKLKAYNLQDKHQWDTEEANVAMGHQADDRNFLAAAEILYSLGFKTFDLLTHNPQKANELTHWGLVINQVISLEIIPTEFNKKYLETKSQKFGHRNLEGDQNGKFH